MAVAGAGGVELAKGRYPSGVKNDMDAPALIIKDDIAAQQGWEHKANHHIWRAARTLTNERQDTVLGRLLRSVNHLHTNFYEKSPHRARSQTL